MKGPRTELFMNIKYLYLDVSTCSASDLCRYRPKHLPACMQAFDLKTRRCVSNDSGDSLRMQAAAEPRTFLVSSSQPIVPQS